MKRTPAYLTTVPNTAEGWAVIDHIRKEFGSSKFRFRGRRKNREELMKSLGRKYSPYTANDNDINLEDLMKLRENDPDVSIAIYSRDRRIYRWYYNGKDVWWQN